MADVDLDDMLDYLASDPKTRSILMYLEHVTDARKFMSAARSAARIKPVVVIKSGRHAEAAKAAHSHTGALAGSDAVYNAAFHRAGVLRVLDMEDLFNAIARKTIHPAIKKGREILTEFEAKTVLKAYGIPTVDTVIAKTLDEVESTAAEILDGTGSEVVVKILSKEITHKSDVGGVALGLPNADAAKKAAQEMLARIQKINPEAHIEGFTIQPMIRRTGAHELIIGMSEDKTFGPVMLFGVGGTAVEVIKDTAMALPPLDLKLAYDLMDETQIYKLLQGYRDRPAADMDAIALTLVRVSQMIAELPEIVELDINPLLADENGVIALDARIIVKETVIESGKLNPRFAIRPYPKKWEKKEMLANGRLIMIRPIRPDDERFYDTFIDKTSPNDIRLRLFASMHHLSHDFIARLTQIDYARAMAFIAIDPDMDEMLGVSRLASDPAYVRAEYGVITRSDMKGQGIGWALMQRLIDYAKSENIQELWGQILRENTNMLKMCLELGFQIEPDPDDTALVIVTLAVNASKNSLDKRT